MSVGDRKLIRGTVGAVYDHPRCLHFDIVGGHRPPLRPDVVRRYAGRLRRSAMFDR